jgi:hypothetical protein
MNRLRRGSLKMLAIAALLIAFSPTFAHAQSTAPAEASAQAAVPAAPAGPVLLAQITAKLSSKNAKVGDALTAKTLRALKLSDGTDLPKGSKLVAKVSLAQSKKAGNGTSMLTFRFDEIDVKGGAVIPIHGEVVAIGPSMAPKEGLGANSVLSRSTTNTSGVIGGGGLGTGSSSGVDPNAGLGSAGAKDEDNIPLGSTLAGVALGHHLDADWTTALQGVKQDIDLDSEVLIKVHLK